MKQDSIQRSLVASGLSLLMMLTVMVGTSFAWFNQTVVNEGARIQSGTLTVEFLSDDDGNFATTGDQVNLASTSDPIFELTNAQPGDTQEKYLRIQNTGSILMNYDMKFDVVDGEGLGSAIVVEVEREEPVIATQTFTGVSIDTEVFSENDSLDEDEFETYRVSVTFDTSAGNEFQGLSYSLDLYLAAYQASNVASKPVFVSTIGELTTAASAAVKGTSIVLLNSISASSTSVNFTQLVNLNLRGFTLTLSSLSVASSDFGFMRFENGIMNLVNYTINTPSATLTHVANLTMNVSGTTSITVSSNTYVLDGVLETGSLTIGGSTSFEPQADSQLVVSGTITKDPGADITPLSGAFINVPTAQQASITPAAGAQVVVVDPANVVTPSDDLQTKIDAASPGATIYLGPGTYNQTFTIDQSLKLFGPNFNVSGNSNSRKPEAVIKPADSTFYNIALNTSNTEISGVRIVRDTLQGVPTASVSAIYLYGGGANNVVIKNNIIDGFYNTYGSIIANNTIQGSKDSPYANLVIENNYLPNGGYILLQGAQAIVRNNVITGARQGIQIQPYRLPLVGGLVENNTVEAYLNGIWFNYANRDAAPWTIQNNTITATNTIVGSEFRVSTTDNSWVGIAIRTFTHSDQNFSPLQAHLNVLNNTINGTAASGRDSLGISFRNIRLEGTYTITGNILSNLSYGFYFEPTLDGNAYAQFSGNLSTIITATTMNNVGTPAFFVV